MNNYIEEWGPGTSGRILSWQEADVKETPYVHIWDIKVQDQNKFKKGHDNIIKSFKEDFDGRFVGFGTYDIGRPGGATHWIGISGTGSGDILKMIDEIQNNHSKELNQYFQDRGKVTDIRDFRISNVRTY